MTTHNRTQRRTARRPGGTTTVAAVRLTDLWPAGAERVETEELVQRAIQMCEDQIGDSLPPVIAEQFGNAVSLQLQNAQRAAEGLPAVTSAICYDAHLAEGRAALMHMLPIARQAVREQPGRFAEVYPPEVRAALADNRFSLADIEAVVIYETPAAQVPGWQADILFNRELRPLSWVIGTPVGRPCPDYAAAVHAGMGILAGLVALAPREDA